MTAKRRRRSSKSKSKPKPKPAAPFSFAGIGAAIDRWWEIVKKGGDPIEALHGHECTKGCWHEQIKKVFDDVKASQEET